MKFKALDKKLKYRLIAAAICIGVLIVLCILRLIPWVSEYVFTRGISRGLIAIATGFTSTLFFSVYELLFALAIVYILYVLIVTIKYLIKKDYKKIGQKWLSFVIVCVGIGSIYLTCAGFGYNRLPLPEEMFADKESVSIEELIEMSNKFTSEYNQLAEQLTFNANGKLVSEYTFDDLAKMILLEFEKLDKGYFGGVKAGVKPFATSKLMSKLGLMGVSFVGEANINADMPLTDLITTIAHEIAHTKGVMREGDANAVSLFVLLNSENPLLKYSAYNAYGYLMTSLPKEWINSEYLKDKLIEVNSNTAKYNGYNFRYWMDSASWLSEVQNFFNNIYLKLSGVKEGTDSYIPNVDAPPVEELLPLPNPQDRLKIEFNDLQKVFLKYFVTTLDKK